MLSTEYRKKLEFICERIATGGEVQLAEMIWVEKLAKANRSAMEILRKARRRASNPEIVDGSMDDFLNKMDIGDPDPSNHRKGFGSAEDIVDWFRQDRTEDWRQHD